MEIRDFMTKENLEMIGLAVMCDRYANYWQNDILVDKNEHFSSPSYDNFRKMIRLGRDITSIMEFFEALNGECRIKDVSKYLEERNIYLPIQRITAVCRRLCASGFLKQRYSDPYKTTIRTFDWIYEIGGYVYKEVTKEIEVRDSFYSLV